MLSGPRSGPQLSRRAVSYGIFSRCVSTSKSIDVADSINMGYLFTLLLFLPMEVLNKSLDESAGIARRGLQ
jgi:hypothetical protein